MKFFKNSLHIWITLTSVAGFLACWASLAQAARAAISPSANQVTAQIMTGLPPMPTAVGRLPGMSSNSGAVQSFRINSATPTPYPAPALQPQPQPQPFQQFFAPRLRTRGS